LIRSRYSIKDMSAKRMARLRDNFTYLLFVSKCDVVEPCIG